MGGDQLNQLISEYIHQNMGFIIFIGILIALSLAAIIYGSVMSIVLNNKEKKLIKETNQAKGGNDHE